MPIDVETKLNLCRTLIAKMQNENASRDVRDCLETLVNAISQVNKSLDDFRRNIGTIEVT